MNSSVLFRGSKRLSLRDEDMEVSKISTIFQVCPRSIYLSDDRNTAVFPDSTGRFSIDGMSMGSHFEVNGDPVGQQQQTPIPSTQGASGATPAAPVGRFSFAARSLPSQTQQTPQYRRPQSRTFSRCVQLVEPQGSSLQPVQTAYLRLTEAETNVLCVSEKVTEQLDSEEPLILCDSKGFELQDGPGTTGIEFWKSQTRKIFCMTENSNREFLAGRRNKQRRRDTPANVRELGHEQMEETRDILATVLEQSQHVKREVEIIHNQFETGNVIVNITREQEKHIKDAFTCTICKGTMDVPMFATCCKSVIGCQTCLTTWYDGQPGMCPKCRSTEGQESSYKMTGINEAIQALKLLIQE